MAGPISTTGAISDPTRYGALTMGAMQFTGLWRQRSPYRDAATPYLMKKFYQGSRFDSIWDGLNREVSARLTVIRRPGNKIFNANTLPPVYSFFSWKYIQSGQEQLRIIIDCQDGTIRDITGGGNVVIWTKAAGAGPARFTSVGTELFFGDGVEQKKFVASSKVWAPNTQFNSGDFIIDPNGNLQAVQVIPGATIAQDCVIMVPLSPSPHYYLQVKFTSNVNWPAGTKVTFSGVTNYSILNGQTLQVINRPLGLIGGFPSGPDVANFNSLTTTAFPPAAETGTGTATNATLSGTSGATPPVWNATLGGLTTDGTLTWQNHGQPIYDWQLPAPTQAPTLTPNPLNRQWRASRAISQWYSIIDQNGNVQAAVSSPAGTYLTGGAVPAFATSLGQVTTDGDVVWICGGRPATWTTASPFQISSCVLDSNNNLQMVTVSGNSGASPPSWLTTIGAVTNDGPVRWTCLGPGTQLLTATRTYGYSYHSIDGSVSTSSPLVPLNPAGSVLGTPGNYYASLSGPTTTHKQIDEIWIWATVQGGSIPLLLAQIPNPNIGTVSTWTFTDSLPDTALNPFIQAPLANSADPPPDGLTGGVLHLQRIWGFVDNAVYYSGGPDTITGNGRTTFPPLNRIAYQAKVIKLLPITVENGGILVFTTSGIFIILGLGTATNPFYSTNFCSKLVLGGFDALDVLGTEIYMMEANAKVSSLVIRYPFDPQSGYSEVGFPVGNEFLRISTGGVTGSFNPATSYLSWNVDTTLDTGMYVADGNGHWFRMAMVNLPESGIVWSPIASLAGGSSAVQSVEISPGVWKLLIGPATAGPILQRDAVSGTQWTDNGTPYPSWDDKGVNILCATGQWTEVAHISAKSWFVGSRPIVSVLLGEVVPSIERPWNVLEVTSPDPPLTPPSKSVFSDRYSLAQNGVADTGDCILTRFDYGTQANVSELLDWGIFATTEDERREEAQK